MSGVGISFGADRIYDVLTGLGKFPKGRESSTTLLFANMDAASLKYIFPIAKALRDRSISVEVYPDAAKLKKQFEYAERKSMPFISINGENEASAGQVNIKNMSTGIQRTFSKDDIEGITAFLDAR